MAFRVGQQRTIEDWLQEPYLDPNHWLVQLAEHLPWERIAETLCLVGCEVRKGPTGTSGAGECTALIDGCPRHSAGEGIPAPNPCPSYTRSQEWREGDVPGAHASSRADRTDSYTHGTRNCPESGSICGTERRQESAVSTRAARGLHQKGEAGRFRGIRYQGGAGHGTLWSCRCECGLPRERR